MLALDARELTVACLEEDALALELEETYGDTRVYVGEPHLSVATRDLRFTGMRRVTEPPGVKHDVTPDVVMAIARSAYDAANLHSMIDICSRLTEIRPGLPLMLVMSTDVMKCALDARLQNLLARPVSDFLVSFDDLDQLHLRLKRLFRIASEPTFENFVPQLRDPESGRLDAKKTAELFGLSLSETTRILGKQLSSVSKTPDAESLQPGLRTFERMASVLLFMFKSPDRLRMWMQTPHREFENKRPIAYVQEGLGEVVAMRLENDLMGQPS
jgi:hypothetical protein